MSYFSKFLRGASQVPPKPQVDHLEEFLKAWEVVKVNISFTVATRSPVYLN
jgi:hypothetical protein